MNPRTHHNRALIIKLLIGLCVFGLVLLSSPLFVDASHTATHPDSVPIDSTIPDNLEGLIYNISVGIGGFFLWIAGSLLDYAVVELVIGMGRYLSTGVGVAVDTLWVLIRDVFNIIFIFGLIYIGFRTILFSEDSGTKKTLGLLIIAALMINFSLFITKAIVDVSNVTSFQIYSALQGKNSLSNPDITDNVSDVSSRGANRGISSTFMDLFNMTTYAQNDVLTDYSDENPILGGRLMFYGLMMMFIMLIAAFVFAAGAFLLISRFIGLIIFMILSPAMFLGFIFPLFKKYQDMWWNKFLKYAFVGPAYLFMLYLATWVISKLATSGSFAAAFTANSFAEGSFIIFLNFFIIAGFLIAALMVAQNMGAYGAAASMGMLKRAGGAVRTKAQNTGRAVARGGFRAATYAPKQAGRYGARAAIGAGSTAALKGYNKWQTKNENKGIAKQLSRFGLDRDIRENLEKGRNAKVGLKYSHAENLAYKEDVDRRRDRQRILDKAQKDLGTARDSSAGSKMTKHTVNSTALKFGDLVDTMDELAKEIGGMSQKEMENAGVEFLSNDNVAIHLTSSHMDKLEASDKISQNEFKGLKEKREAALIKVAKGEYADGIVDADWINSKKAGEVAKMPAKVILNENVAKGIQTATLSKIAQDRTIKTSQEQELRATLKTEIDALEKIPSRTAEQERRRDSLEKWFETPVAQSFGV